MSSRSPDHYQPLLPYQGRAPCGKGAMGAESSTSKAGDLLSPCAGSSGKSRRALIRDLRFGAIRVSTPCAGEGATACRPPLRGSRTGDAARSCVAFAPRADAASCEARCPTLSRGCRGLAKAATRLRRGTILSEQREPARRPQRPRGRVALFRHCFFGAGLELPGKCAS